MSQRINRKLVFKYFNEVLLENKFLDGKETVHVYNDIRRAVLKKIKTGPFTSIYSSPVIMRFTFCELDFLSNLLFSYICNCLPTFVGDITGNNLLDSLFVYYKFDEPSGATVTDYSTSEKDLTIINATATRGRPTIRTGGEASTNFTNLAVAQTTDVIPGIYNTTLSISTWYRPDNTVDGTFRFLSGGTPLIDDGTSDWDNHFCIFIAADGTPGLFWESTMVNVIYQAPAYKVTGGQPHHFVAVKDGVNKKAYLYMNGVKIIDVTYTLEYVGGVNVRLAIGNSQPGGESAAFSTRGDVQDFAMWNRVLAPCEAAILYNGGRGIGYNQFN